jgi:capsular exopolysaccharide synthesis family protein
MRRRWVVLLVFLLTTALGAAFAFSQPKRYESAATIAFTPDFENDTGFIPPTDTLDGLVQTYAQTAKSRSIRMQAEQALGSPLPGTIDTETQQGAGILRIVGKDTDPNGAAVTARVVANTFISSIDDNRLLIARVVDPALPSSTPVQPRPPLIIAVSALLGLVAGLMLALALEHFRRRVESSADVAEFTQAPVIGRLPRARRLQRSGAGLIWADRKLASLHEGFRALRTNIEFVTKGVPASIQITSPNPSQGKSTIVANLGIAFAQVGVDTLILDADLRRPYQHNIFGLDNSRGLSTLMAIPDSDVEPQVTGVSNLWVMPSGPVPPNSTEMLHIRFERVLDEMRRRFALVLVDSPPILPVSDARLIAPHTDGVILVISSGTQKPAGLRSALEKLSLVEANILGIVLNQAGGDVDAVDAYETYRYEDDYSSQRPVGRPPASPGSAPESAPAPPARSLPIR